jgi:hypothetical protein
MRFRERRKTKDVDPKALFIWETENRRVVIGKSVMLLPAALIVSSKFAPAFSVWSLIKEILPRF